MRRKDLEIAERAEVETIIEEARVCRLAMCDGDRPYVVPLSFAYRDNTLYFHTADGGKEARTPSKITTKFASRWMWAKSRPAR